MREFASIAAAAIGSSLLGAGFGWLIGRYAPELLTALFPLSPIQSPAAVATALGAINGLLLGAATMTAALFITALRTRSAK